MSAKREEPPSFGPSPIGNVRLGGEEHLVAAARDGAAEHFFGASARIHVGAYRKN